MSGQDTPWIDDPDQPFDDDTSQRQVAGVLHQLDGRARRVLDVGCGGGRVLVPIAAAGHDALGVDHDAAALRRCRAALDDVNASAALHVHDMLEPWPEALAAQCGSLDAVLCLGNTFMTVVDVDDAVALLTRCRELLRDGGMLLLDDLAGEHWPELTEGNWQSGLSEDGQAQLVWAEDDAVFALRQGDAVDADCWTLRDDDRPLRLWTAGALRLAARLSGFSGPCRLEQSNLVVLGR